MICRYPYLNIVHLMLFKPQLGIDRYHIYTYISHHSDEAPTTSFWTSSSDSLGMLFFGEGQYSER